MKRLLTLVAFFATIQASAQQVNPVPDYVFRNQMSVGRGTVTDTAAYFSIGPRYGATKGFMPPIVGDTATFSSGKRNGLLIFSVQKNKFLYWDSVRVQWSDMAGSSGSYIVAGDTAAMLAPYLRKADTTAMLTPYIRAAGNGLTKSGQSLLVDTATIATRARVQKAVDSINANVALKVNISDTASMLTPYTRGSGTTNYLPKFTGTRTFGNSVAFDNGSELLIGTTTDAGAYALQVAGSIYNTTGAVLAASSGNVGIGTASPSEKLHAFGNILASDNAGAYPRFISTVGAKSWEIGYRSGTTNYEIREDGNTRLAISNGGEVLINTLTDAGDYRLQVNGAGIFGSGTTDNQVLLAFPQDLKLRYRQSISSAYGFLLDSANVESLFLTSFESVNTQALLLMGDGYSKNIFGFSHSTDYGVTYTADFVIEATGIIGIGTNAPNTSAQLDISSTTRGFLPPRMTTTQRNAISSPAAGLVIYNTTDSKLQVYTTSWTDLH